MDTNRSHTLGTFLLGKTRGAVLGLLLTHPDEQFHVRQIARLSGATLGPVQKELKLLERYGVLKSNRVGHQLMYGVNAASPVHDELRSLVIKTVGLIDILKASLAPLAQRIQLAFIFGSFAGGEENLNSDVDLMIIGEVSVAQIAGVLADAQRRLNRELNPTIYRPAEFNAKLRQGHHFLGAVISEPKLFVIGDEHELSGMAGQRLDPASRPGRLQRSQKEPPKRAARHR